MPSDLSHSAAWSAQGHFGIAFWVSEEALSVDGLHSSSRWTARRSARVLILGFLLLLLAFRSLLIPAVAAVMNLLAAAASFGVLVAVFQLGWGLHLLNLGQPGPVESFLPVPMLAVLFGLSMDYEVFLVSRIREEWAAGGDNHQAVRTGQATTGRVIIAAATIMILVFSAFILSGQQVIGEIGIGLAAAVLLDAFLLRTSSCPPSCTCPAGPTGGCRAG